MTALEYLKIFTQAGAVGVLGIVVYWFVRGKIVSEHSVSKIMKAQSNHIGDLRTDIKAKMDEMIVGQTKIVDVLEEIKKNGAMNREK